MVKYCHLVVNAWFESYFSLNIFLTIIIVFGVTLIKTAILFESPQKPLFLDSFPLVVLGEVTVK